VNDLKWSYGELTGLEQALDALRVSIEARKLQIRPPFPQGAAVDLVCATCKTRPVSALYLPCSHIYTCMQCAKDAPDCPHCGVTAERLVALRTKPIERSLGDSLEEEEEEEAFAVMENKPKLHGAAEIAHIRSVHGVVKREDRFNQTAEIMAENAQALNKRGEAIDRIQEDTSEMAQQSGAFAEKAKKIRQICEKKNSFF